MSGTALVVGGGIAGLVAAHRLSTAGWDVTLAEATSVLGGAVSPRFLDVPSHGETGAPETQTLELDGGAESFAVRGAAVRALVEELGLGEKIVAPEPLGSWLHGPAGPVRAPRLGIVGIPGDLDAEDLAAALTPAGLVLRDARVGVVASGYSRRFTGTPGIEGRGARGSGDHGGGR